MFRRAKWGLLALVPATAVLCALGCGDQTAKAPTGAATAPPGPSASAPSPTAPGAAASTAPTAAASPTTSSTAVATKPAAGKAVVAGKVRYAGDPPKRKLINFGPEKKCHEGHATPPMEESLVVSADKGVQWALVRVAGKVPGSFKPPASAAPLEFDQKGCMFSPHVLAVMAGQEIAVKNSDPILHNVRAEAVINQGFNRNLPKAGDLMKVKFDSPEVGIHVKCDVHFWMEGYIHVLANPFFAVTAADGSFAIPDLPPGSYKLEVWHEKLGKQTQDVTVADGETKAVEFELRPKS